MSTTYLETGSQNPAYNLAFEQYVLENRLEGDYLILWQNDNTIVVGQNQNTEAEINRSFVEEHGIHVIRRMTGGGAVYHDLGNLNYSFITDLGDAESMSIAAFGQPVVKALKGLGLDAEISGRNDIQVNGLKVSGTAQRITRGRILHHGTLLFDSNPNLVSGALNVDPEKFKGKSAKSVKARIGNIRSFLKEDMDLPAFWSYLIETLAGEGFEKDTLSEEELAEVEKLKESKYDTWEWNFGRSPKFEMTNKKRYDGGTLEVHLTVAKQGIIEDLIFYGDFLAVKSVQPVVDKLIGCRFREDAVRAVLDEFVISEHFGAITEDEVMDCLFHAN